jgi:hypothetical protein
MKSPADVFHVGARRCRRVRYENKIPDKQEGANFLMVCYRDIVGRGGISYRGMVVSSESGRLVRHAHEFLENLHKLLQAMERIEGRSR